MTLRVIQQCIHCVYNEHNLNIYENGDSDKAAFVTDRTSKNSAQKIQLNSPQLTYNTNAETAQCIFVSCAHGVYI